MGNMFKRNFATEIASESATSVVFEERTAQESSASPSTALQADKKEAAGYNAASLQCPA